MAKNEDGKWENSKEEEEEALSLCDLPINLIEEEEEEEALSLCDLPINLIEEEENHRHHQSRKDEEIQETEEDFDFSQFGSTKSEMCSADDIFFQGQILPFRLSVSSETSTNYKSSQDSLKNPRNNSISRSESMDHGFTSFSSRSSSSRSQFSSTSTTTTTSSSANNQPARISISKQPRSRIQNQFHTHPSPKPQIKLSTTNHNRAIRKSTAWDIFRLGLVRTPELELQDLKNRTSVSRNSSSNSSNSSNANQEKQVEKQRRKHQNFFDKRSKTGLLSGCSCTVSAVKPVPLNTPNNKTEEKQKMIKRLKKKKKKKKMTEKQRGKQAMSRHRTFEWIKELSHVSFDDHQS